MKKWIIIWAVVAIAAYAVGLHSCNNYRASRAPADWLYISPTGNNTTGNGTAAAPWATLTYACTQATSGDTIFVTAGNYTETARAALPVSVSILGDSTNIPVITYTYAASGTRDGAIYLNSAAGAPTNGNQSISYINLNGSSLTSNRAIAVNYRYNVDVHHCTIENFDDTGVWFYVSPSYAHATGNSVYNCTINNCSSAASGFAGCVRFEGQDGFLCYDNTISNKDRVAGTNGTCINSDNNVRYRLYDNTFYRNDHEDDDWNFFLEMWDYQGDCEIYDNTFYGLATLDFSGSVNEIIAGCTYGLKIYNNKMINSANGLYTKPTDTKAIIAITIENGGHEKVYIYNNLIQRFGWGIELATATSETGGTWDQDWVMKDIYIYNNIIEGVGYSDYQYCYGFLYLNETNLDGFTVTTDNINILNNTITAMVGSTYQGIRFSGGDTLSNLNIKNNIIQGFDSYGIYLGEHATDGLSMTNVAVTYNCMNGNGTNTVGIDGDIVQTNFAVATGNITTAPAFQTNSLRLSSTSPCINAGLSVGLTSDYFGHRVPQQDTVDIGAHEYGDYLVKFGGKYLMDGNGKFKIIH